MLKKLLLLVLSCIVAVIALFLMGRYGWKLGGFHACQSAGIDSVEVSENVVHITGYYPGSFPEGFCGYYAKERNGKLYVGFQFSAIFGFFDTGDFDITIPTNGEIEEVIIKTSMNERPVWNADVGFIPQSERYGVFVKLERKDVCMVSMSYKDFQDEAVHTNYAACESGACFFMDNDIIYVAKEADAPVPFTLTVQAEDGTVVASEEFYFDAGKEKMYLTITEDGRICETEK